MRRYTYNMQRTLARLGRVARRSWLAVACGAMVGAAEAQTQVMIEYGGSLARVVAMDEQYPLIEGPGGRERVYDGRVSVVPVNYFTDGAIRVVSKDAAIGSEYGSAYGGQFFRFLANIEAERDFEDCFILFMITPDQGEPTYVMRELPDIGAEEVERLMVSVPVNPAYGGGTFGYKIFSDGEEIQIVDPEATAQIRNDPQTSSSASGRSVAGSVDRSSAGGRSHSRASMNAEVEVVDAHLPVFPKGLVGDLQGGYAELVYTIDEKGKVIEVLDVRADHSGLIPEALQAVTQSRYSPATYRGRPQQSTVRQRLFFNEFASFPEQIVTVADPPLNDRPPIPVYYPMPQVKVQRESEVEVELTVDKLGRAHGTRVVSSPNDELADATAEKVQNWIFLPAVENGQAVETTLVLPVQFTPGESAETPAGS